MLDQKWRSTLVLVLKSGGEVCEVRDSAAGPGFVFWYHNSSVINHQAGVAVDTVVTGPRQQSLWVAPVNTTVSTLTITHTAATHAGNYTCAPTLAASHSVRLFVSTGVKLFFCFSKFLSFND